MDKYLEKFYILAGETNKIPTIKDSKKYQIWLVEFLNEFLKCEMSDDLVSYYKELLKYVSVTELILAAAQDPARFWISPEVALGDLKAVKESMVNFLNNRAVGDFIPDKITVQLSNLGDNLIKRCPNEDRVLIDAVAHYYSLEKYNTFGELITDYLNIYSLLIKAFYNKLDERANELVQINDADTALAYTPKEDFSLFYELHNFFRKMLRDLSQININDSEICNHQIEVLTNNILVMDVIKDILGNEKEEIIYQKLSELDDNSVLFWNVDSYLRKWLRNLKKEYGKDIVLN